MILQPRIVFGTGCCVSKVCMWVRLKVFLLLYSAHLTQSSDLNVITPTYRNTSCNDTVPIELDECWNKLSEVTYHGIPSNPQEIDNACRVFVSGMECVDRWSQMCPSAEAQEMLESSIMGTFQVFKWLCTNNTIKEEFLVHANCYTRASSYLDACNNHFIMTLDKIDHANDMQNLCCVRLRYFQCVDEVARVLCSTNSITVFRKITKLLMQTTLRTYYKRSCTEVDYKKCSSVKSAAPPSIEIVPVSQIGSLYEILWYFLCWLASQLSLQY